MPMYRPLRGRAWAAAYGYLTIVVVASVWVCLSESFKVGRAPSPQRVHSDQNPFLAGKFALPQYRDYEVLGRAVQDGRWSGESIVFYGRSLRSREYGTMVALKRLGAAASQTVRELSAEQEESMERLGRHDHLPQQLETICNATDGSVTIVTPWLAKFRTLQSCLGSPRLKCDLGHTGQPVLSCPEVLMKPGDRVRAMVDAAQLTVMSLCQPPGRTVECLNEADSCGAYLHRAIFWTRKLLKRMSRTGEVLEDIAGLLPAAAAQGGCSETALFMMRGPARREAKRRISQRRNAERKAEWAQLDENDYSTIISGVARALEALASEGYGHGDIAEGQVMVRRRPVDGSLDVVLIDLDEMVLLGQDTDRSTVVTRGADVWRLKSLVDGWAQAVAMGGCAPGTQVRDSRKTPLASASDLLRAAGKNISRRSITVDQLRAVYSFLGKMLVSSNGRPDAA